MPVSLDLFGEEERIARCPAFLEGRIEAGCAEQEQVQARIDDCLALAGDCHASYMSIDNSLWRIANQAFFDKLMVLPEDGIGGKPGEPFNSFFNPDVQTRTLRFKERMAELGPQTGDVGGLNSDPLVVTRGGHGGQSA